MIREFLNAEVFGSSKFNDKQKIGIGGFLAEARVRDRMTLTSDVPTTYVEDGSLVNDHIINNPIIIDISGEVSDVVVRPDPLTAAYKSTVGEIGKFSNYLPSRTLSQVSQLAAFTNTASDAIDAIDQVENDAQDLYSIFQGQTEGIGTQEDFVQFIKAIHSSKQLIAIETDLGTMNNMRIVSVTFEKVDNNFMSYNMTLQEVRFVKTQLVGVEKYFQKPTGDAATQAATKTDKGTVPGDKVERSALTRILEAF